MITITAAFLPSKTINRLKKTVLKVSFHEEIKKRGKKKPPQIGTVHIKILGE
jgi:hypothetical protein